MEGKIEKWREKEKEQGFLLKEQRLSLRNEDGKMDGILDSPSKHRVG